MRNGFIFGAALIALTAGSIHAQTQIDKVIATEGEGGDSFGSGSDIDGDTCVVGALTSDLFANSSGAAFVFQDDGTGNWNQVTALEPLTPDIGGEFGRSVAISGDVIIVGASRDDAEEDLGGAAYLFERNEGGPDNWGQVIRLIPTEVDEIDQFGFSVDIEGDWAVVGAPGDDDAGGNSGAAYVYQRVGGVWTFHDKLVPGLISIFAEFGWSVGISGDTIVCGTRRDDTLVNNGGSAFIFQRVGNEWQSVQKIYSDDLENDDWFGQDVAIDGDVVVAGARNEDELGNNAGAAYIFERNKGGPDNWGQVQKLLADDGAFGDLFGETVHVEGDLVIVGAPNANNDSGEAYFYSRGDGSWPLIDGFMGKGVGGDDRFGRSVALGSGLAIIGATGDDDNGSSAGAAYIFTADPPCAADLTGDGVVDTADLLALLGDWGFCGVCAADLTDDNVVDTADLLNLLGQWGPCQ